MSITEGWSHKDEWRNFGKDFAVVVSRHTVRVRKYDCDEGPHRWCVYAYIYPNHPHFGKFDGNNMWQDAATAMPLHSGPSYLKWHYYDDGKPCSVVVGADYSHIYDDYTNYATPDDAGQVFRDAEELRAWLTNYRTGQAEE